MKLRIAITMMAALVFCGAAHAQKPEWCEELPRAVYRGVERVSAPDPWFEVYKIRPGVFAIYEPRQAEEVISYLIVGTRKAILFDTGLGIGNIRKVVTALTPLPVSVVNSHTHNDHVGDNWRFGEIYGMDMDFTRANARGSRDDAQAELAPDQLCGDLPPGFDVPGYSTRPFRISHCLHDCERLDLGGPPMESVAPPGHTPDSISLLDAHNGLLFPGDTYYPGPIFLYRPETDLVAYQHSVERLAALAPKLQLLLPSPHLPLAHPPHLPH